MTGRAHSNTVWRLILKDVHLQRWNWSGALVAGLLAIGAMALGGGIGLYMGGVLMVTVLVAHGTSLAILTVVEERQQQTLPFILSLPVSRSQHTLAKILGNLLIFGATWGILLAGSLAVVLGSADLPDGLVAYVVLVAVEILVSTCLILSVAMVTQSLAWSIGTMIAGNLVFNGFVFLLFNTPAFVASAESPSVVWPVEVLSLLAIGLACAILALGLAFVISVRRKDVL